MIIVRSVFQAKYGKSDELIQLVKEGDEIWPSKHPTRRMTDLSGKFFTLVGEAEYESLAEFEADRQRYFDDPRFATWFEHMTSLVESGSREFYILVE